MGRLARWCHRERRFVLVGWLTALVFVAGCGAAFGGSLSSSFEAPASESQRALDLLFDRFPEQAGAGAEIVFRSDTAVDDPPVVRRMQELFAEVEGHPGIAEVVSPYGPLGAFQISEDRTIAFARVRFAGSSLDISHRHGGGDAVGGRTCEQRHPPGRSGWPGGAVRSNCRRGRSGGGRPGRRGRRALVDLRVGSRHGAFPSRPP